MELRRVPLKFGKTFAPKAKLGVAKIQKRSIIDSAVTRKQPKFGFMFDIDGVFVRGKEVFSQSAEALRLLLDSKGKFQIPTVFVTNAGNTLRSKKAEQLSERLGIKIPQDQMIVAHSPLKMFKQFHDKTVLVSGQGPVVEIAKNLGFQKVVTIENLRRSYPLLDMVDHNRRQTDEPDEYETYFPVIEAVILFGEPVRWETNLQLIIDVLMTNGKPDHRPQLIPYPHIPLVACNIDEVWMSEACMPRFGHGCFLSCLEHLYKKLAGKELKYTAQLGKPFPITYHHAEFCLNQHAKQLGAQRPLRHLYCVGDNPDTDIRGANSYNLYLGSRMESSVKNARRGKMISETSDALRNVPQDTSELELLDSAEVCESILVNTGVYSDSRNAHEMGTTGTHIGFTIGDDLRKPTYMVANVLEAVQLVLGKEGMLS